MRKQYLKPTIRVIADCGVLMRYVISVPTSDTPFDPSQEDEEDEDDESKAVSTWDDIIWDL